MQPKKIYNNATSITIIVPIILAWLFTLSGCGSNSSTTSTQTEKVTNQQVLIFDAKQLLSANKDTVDKMLGQTGIQDESEPYVYNFGDSSAAFDDNGICLNLYLDTEDKKYKSYDEDEILKKYGLDLTDSYYKGDSSIGKHYTKIKDFNELDIWYDDDRNIRALSFYPKGIQEFNNFLDTKSKNKNKINSTSNKTPTPKKSSSNTKSNRQKNNVVYDSTRSDLYNDYCYELESLEGGSAPVLSSNDAKQANDAYIKFNNSINRLWNDLKKQLPKDQYDTLLKDETNWVNSKMKKYPTADNKDGTFQDKIGAIRMTDERIGLLLKYLK